MVSGLTDSIAAQKAREVATRSRRHEIMEVVVKGCNEIAVNAQSSLIASRILNEWNRIVEIRRERAHCVNLVAARILKTKTRCHLRIVFNRWKCIHALRACSHASTLYQKQLLRKVIRQWKMIAIPQLTKKIQVGHAQTLEAMCQTDPSLGNFALGNFAHQEEQVERRMEVQFSDQCVQAQPEMFSRRVQVLPAMRNQNIETTFNPKMARRDVKIQTDILFTPCCASTQTDSPLERDITLPIDRLLLGAQRRILLTRVFQSWYQFAYKHIFDWARREDNRVRINFALLYQRRATLRNVCKVVLVAWRKHIEGLRKSEATVAWIKRNTNI